uniref:Protein kinase domain-containing protein n=1 Tax=Triticum urartu TaxID=4572 RepID=A0A8R7PUX9_TRIUA
MQRLPGMPCRIDFSDIKKATKNFDGTMKLGSGTFGSVYRCRLPAAPETGRPEMEVAVKKFTRNDDRRFDDFLEEVSVINRLRHKNIVPLIVAGFDDDDAKRLMLLGLACTNPNPSNRPSMLEVVQVITKLKLPPAVPPKKPTFVWPPQGWSSYNSYFSTETSTIYASGSST